ncbi:MAG: response regulator [Alphaproteobacteria bacterium]|nr:response regulator [Alphaproteobacteria bacterium]
MQLSDATILLVDDEPYLLEIFRMWFERHARRVVTAENGKLALEQAAEHRPDLIVSDVRMPVMDGIEMVRRLKAAGTSSAGIVFVSGYTDLSQRDCFDLGVEAMLPKPLRRASLMATVQRCLLDGEERWRERPAEECQGTLSARFESLPAAQREGLIAFGSGGFCIRSGFAAAPGQAIGLDIAFDDGGQALKGQGIVRWLQPGEQQVGVEISYVDDENRGWVAALAARNESRSFIPRSSLGVQSL